MPSLGTSFLLALALHLTAGVALYSYVATSTLEDQGEPFITVEISGDGGEGLDSTQPLASLAASDLSAAERQPSLAPALIPEVTAAKAKEPELLMIKPVKKVARVAPDTTVPKRKLLKPEPIAQAALNTEAFLGDTQCLSTSCSAQGITSYGDASYGNGTKSAQQSLGLKLVHSPIPRYPEAARRAGFQGKVLLDVSVQSDGKPEAVSLVSSSGRPDCDASALETVRERWRFNQHDSDGDVRQRIAIVFKLR